MFVLLPYCTFVIWYVISQKALTVSDWVLSIIVSVGIILTLLSITLTRNKHADADSGWNRKFKNISRKLKNRYKKDDLLYGPDKSGNEVQEDMKTHSIRMKSLIQAKERLETEHKEKSINFTFSLY